MPQIDLDAIRSFVAVADEMAFGKAAERLAVSTPALTRRIQRLEHSLGAPLFERSTRHVALSQSGRLFLPRARQALAELDAAIQSVRDDAALRAGVITLAALPTVTTHLLPRIIRDFRARFPQIRLRVIECGAAEILRRLHDGDVEFGFTFRAGHETELAFDPILIDPYCLIMPPNHPLAARAQVAWQELKSYALITAGRQSGNMLLLEEALRGVDWRPDGAYEIDHLTTSLGLVEAGLGIAVVPDSSLPPGPHNGLVMRRLIDPVVTRTLGLFRRRNEILRPTATQFLNTARRAATSFGPPPDRADAAETG